MLEGKKPKYDIRPPVRRPASTWWLLAKSENRGAEVLLADCGGEQALPVFSSGGEADMFVWLRGAVEDGWQVRETSAGELVSILYGLCAGVGRVALDPSPLMAPETIRLVCVSRERFVSWIVDSPSSYSASAHNHARGLVRLL